MSTDTLNPHDWRCAYNGLTEVDHDWTLRSETYGDDGVINGTATNVWLECENCGHQKEPGPHDLDDDYDDWGAS